MLAIVECSRRVPLPDVRETAEMAALHRRAKASWKKGEVREAVVLFTRAYQLARKLNRPALAGRYLGSLGGLAFLQRQYQTACKRLFTAKHACEEAGDAAGAAMQAANLSTVYIQIGDMEAARIAAEQGLKEMRGQRVTPGTEEQLLCNLGTALGGEGRLAESEQALEAAIDGAARLGDETLLAQAWDSLGSERLKRGANNEAARDFLQAYRIQAPRHDPSLPGTLAYLSEVRQRQGDLRSARHLIDAALSGGGGGVPLWYLYLRKGSVLAAIGHAAEALHNYRRAVSLARLWRAKIAPSDSLRSGTAGPLSYLYDPYIDELMAQGGRRAEMEAFAAIEEYRAAALRETLSESAAWRKKLPDEYWQTLSRLREAEIKLAASANRITQAEVSRLEQRMNEIEAREYTEKIRDIPSIPRENFLPLNTLRNIQRRLSSQELLLSFHFGERGSYVWAVAHRHAEVHRLAPAGPLQADARKLERALKSNAPDSAQLGRRIYSELLAGLTPLMKKKTEWIVAADNVTLEIPWAALEEPASAGRCRFVVEDHSVRLVPSAMSLEDECGSTRKGDLFLGIGDGVYNLADPREKKGGIYDFARVQAAMELPRLVGSGRELEVCAHAWRGRVHLLTGRQVSRAGFLRELSRKPAVIHIAAHVLATMTPEESVIHLGLGASGTPQLLTSYDVANLAVEGSTVVMSGCASATASAPEGAGLLGLARAWLIAGAGSVIGTRWPVADDSGVFFEAFYRNLRSGSNVTVSCALRQAELEMLQSGSWRAQPRYWASFIDVGKE